MARNDDISPEEQLCIDNAGTHIDEFDLGDLDWHGLWPVIDGDCLLTGEIADSSSSNMLSYNNDAMIDRDDAIAAGWNIDSPEPGFANPPAA